MKHSGARKRESTILELSPWQIAGFGLYVHWPFCQSKCPYCDFNSHVAGQQDEEIWEEALRRELRRYHALTEGRVLSSIFFGGGTPSLMSPSLVERVILEATRLWRPSNDIEITLEANPSSAEAEKFRSLRLAGVNRVSLGVQALRDDDLRRLGRLHDVKTALRAIDAAARQFDRFSFDLIYARQDQSEDQWARELEEAIAIGSNHMSLYQLTVEEGTAFGDRYARGGLRGLPDEARSVALYAITQELTTGANLSAYEVSNHARSGHESRHNLIYWRGGDYVGVGPGAHGRITDAAGRRVATEAKRDPAAWLSAGLKGYAEAERTELSPEETAEELLLMGLRLAEGVSLDRLRKQTGFHVTENAIAYLQALNLIDLRDQTLRTTDEGRMLLNSVLSKLDLLPVSDKPATKTVAKTTGAGR